MRVNAHITGVLLMVAAVSSIGLIPALTRDVGGSVELPFSDIEVPAQDKDVLVVFAGFPGCGNTCPTTLMFLDRAYREVNDERLGVAFLNVLLHTPSEVSRDYARGFNDEFIGYSVTPERKTALYTQMGLMADGSIESVSDHKANIFIYGREDSRWLLKSVYQKTPSHDDLVAHLRDVLRDSGRS